MNGAPSPNGTTDPGGTIRAGRRRKGLTQDALADRAGCSVDYVRLLERGYVPRYSDVLPRVLAVLADPGSPLATRRLVLGMTPEQLALYAGADEETISQVETGVLLPSRSMQERLAAVLQTTVDTIFPNKELTAASRTELLETEAGDGHAE